MRFAVEASAAEAEAFARATGLERTDDRLPLTYPMCWLVAPDVRAALLALVPEADMVLVHESQSFDYGQPLRSGQRYALHLSARRDTAPERLFLEGTIADEAGVTQASLATILRLVAAPASSP